MPRDRDFGASRYDVQAREGQKNVLRIAERYDIYLPIQEGLCSHPFALAVS